MKAYVKNKRAKTTSSSESVDGQVMPSLPSKVSPREDELSHYAEEDDVAADRGAFETTDQDNLTKLPAHSTSSEGCEEKKGAANRSETQGRYVSTVIDRPQAQKGPPAMWDLDIRTAEWIKRRRRVDFAESIIHDVDALCYITRRVRMEADPCAKASNETYCWDYDLEPWQPMSARPSLFIHDACNMAEIVAVAIAQKACGTFFCPAESKLLDRLIIFPTVITPESPQADRLSLQEVMDFFHLVKFIIPRVAIRGGGGHFKKGGVAYFCNFGKSFTTPKRREEVCFTLTYRKGYPRSLPLNPQIHHMVSPLHDLKSDGMKVVQEDDAPGAPALIQPEGQLVINYPPSRWNLDNLKTLANSYPDEVVADVAVAVAEGKFQPFCGDLNKTVVWRDRPSTPEDQERLRLACQASVDKGYSWGPYPFCPFPNARPYPAGLAAKHKYDPLCEEFRMVSDLSAGTPLSVNDLTWSPHLLYVSLTVQMFCNECVSAGRGATFSQGDIPAAFKLNPNNRILLPLFCTKLRLQDEDGKKYDAWFGDIMNCFGWTAAEQGFGCQLGLIKWMCFIEGLRRLMWYVDNYFQVHPMQSAEVTNLEIEHTRKLIHWMGPDLHKCSQGPRGRVLGWDVDLDYGPDHQQVLLLPEDKRLFFCKRFRECATQVRLTLEDLLQLTGILNFMAQGIKVLKAFSPILGSMRKRAVITQEQRRNQSKSFANCDVMITQDEESKCALEAIDETLRTHGGVCPMIEQFGPCSRAGVYIWSDASSGRKTKSEPPSGFGTLIYLCGRKTVMGFTRIFTQAEREQVQGLTAVSSPTIELIGAEQSLFRWLKLCKRRRILFGIDAEVAILGLRKGYSPSPGFRQAIREMQRRVISLESEVRFYHLPRTRAPIGICDLLSRGYIQEAMSMCLRVFGVPMTMVY